jgi:serine protease Do
VKGLLKGHWGFILISLLVSLIFFSSCTAKNNITGNDSPLPSTFANVVDKVMPSVVYIFVEVESGIPGRIATGSGSGVILRSDGYILTNRHVVENANRAEVTFQDRSVYEVSQIWLDDILDLAVIKIDADNLPIAAFANPEKTRVGDWSIALGHPLGLSPSEGGATVTVGVVSNLGRSFALEGVPFYDIIQTDAAINPGNSGGPLININGEVIGINTAGSGVAQNINFAINVATARRVFEDIIEFGRVVHPSLGAVLDDITPSLVCEKCLSKRIGTVIVSIEPGGPAEKAQLKENDIIFEFDGIEIISAAQLIKELWKNKVGETVSMKIWRGATEIATSVLLTELVFN